MTKYKLGKRIYRPRKPEYIKRWRDLVYRLYLRGGYDYVWPHSSHYHLVMWGLKKGWLVEAK